MSGEIYYLDDESALCEIFEELFEGGVYRVTTFVDADTAIKACLEHKPDVFFIDYRLTDTTGDMVANSLPSDLPKILVTGELNRPTEYHFEAILSKPFSIMDVLALVSKYCD